MSAFWSGDVLSRLSDGSDLPHFQVFSNPLLRLKRQAVANRKAGSSTCFHADRQV